MNHRLNFNAWFVPSLAIWQGLVKKIRRLKPETTKIAKWLPIKEGISVKIAACDLRIFNSLAFGLDVFVSSIIFVGAHQASMQLCSILFYLALLVAGRVRKVKNWC
jgi:hypothetical protein